MARASLRENIVNAAVEQFHIFGFTAAGVKDITGAAGAPKGSFYNHFESKEALAVVAVERYGATRGLTALGDTSVPPLVRLRQHFEALRDESLAYGFSRGCLIGDLATEIADHSEVVRKAVQDSLQQWCNALSGAIAEAQQAGEVTKAMEADTIARFILGAWEGALVSARSDKSSKAFESFFTVVFGVVLR
ncbi:TetR family transcriptional regulator C-terminal domain-containing protein [Streptomyces sp. NPDC098781]|uniref:TetR/AcrR family transcriptional regulator n=1 Tax=Streptomyces sp. NPDC098781 TaxID=3366097 RepID=UPI003828DAE3